jgi:hypothetical protein
MKNRNFLPFCAEFHSTELHNARNAQEASRILHSVAMGNHKESDGVGYLEISYGTYTTKNTIRLDIGGKAKIVTEEINESVALLTDDLSCVSYYRSMFHKPDNLVTTDSLTSRDAFNAQSGSSCWNYTITTFDTSVSDKFKEAKKGLNLLQKLSSSDPAKVNFGSKSQGGCRFYGLNYPVDERELVSLVYNEVNQLVAALECTIFVTDPLLSPLESQAAAGVVVHSIYAIPEARGRLIGSTLARMVADLVDEHCLSSKGFMGKISNRANNYDLHCSIDAYTNDGANFGERLMDALEVITEDLLENHALPFNDFLGSILD